MYAEMVSLAKAAANVRQGRVEHEKKNTNNGSSERSFAKLGDTNQVFGINNIKLPENI